MTTTDWLTEPGEGADMKDALDALEDGLPAADTSAATVRVMPLWARPRAGSCPTAQSTPVRPLTGWSETGQPLAAWALTGRPAPTPALTGVAG